MAKKKSDGNFEIVEDALSKTEQYIEDNQKSLSIIVAAIVIIVGGYLAYNKLYIKPLQEEALANVFFAEQYFGQDSFNLALNGDGNNLGFLDIIDEYGITKVGNLANYYAGISYLRLGDYESAIEYLKSFDTDDFMLEPVSLGSIGDANMELENTDEALNYYLKAAEFENEFTTPIYLMKAGLAYEKLGDYENALKLYEKIDVEYEKSNEGRYIKKYIQRAKMK